MNNIKQFFLFLTFPIFLFECTTDVPLKSSRRSTEIKSATFLTLPGVICSKKDYKTLSFNEELSSILEISNIKIFPQVLKDYTDIKTSEIKRIDDDVKLELNNIIINVEKKGRIKKVVLSKKIVFFFKKNGSDFVIVNFPYGVSMRKTETKSLRSASEGIALWTLNHLNPLSKKEELTNIVFILDIKRQNLAYYRKHTLSNRTIERKENLCESSNFNRFLF